MLTEFISSLFGNDIISTLFMSFVPLIELKGGIVFARGVNIGTFESFGLAYLGSTIAFIPVFFLLIPLLKWLKKIKLVNKFANKIESYFQGKAQETLTKEQGKKNRKAMSETFIKQLGVFLFVAIPLPMTGVWTGTAIAVFLNLKFHQTILPVLIGNLVAGGIILGLAEFCIAVWNINSLDYILWGLLALAVILLVVTIVKISKKKPNQQVLETSITDKIDKEGQN